MSPTTDSANQPLVYEIRIDELLGDRWSKWFDHMSVTRETNGTTLLTGPIADQAALYGLLIRIRDLGLPLLSIVRIEPVTNHWKDTS